MTEEIKKTSKKQKKEKKNGTIKQTEKSTSPGEVDQPREEVLSETTTVLPSETIGSGHSDSGQSSGQDEEASQESTEDSTGSSSETQEEIVEPPKATIKPKGRKKASLHDIARWRSLHRPK